MDSIGLGLYKMRQAFIRDKTQRIAQLLLYVKKVSSYEGFPLMVICNIQ